MARTCALQLCPPAMAPGQPRPPAPSSLDLDPHLRRVAHAACIGACSHRSPREIARETSISPPQVLVEQAVAHPTLDVALLRVQARADPVVTLGLEAMDDGIRIPQEAYSLVFGPHNAGTSHLRQLADQTIVSMDSTFLTAQVTSASGPCGGDSGGPLLIDDTSGAPAIAGILSNGSMSCRGTDVYVRADRIRTWVERLVAAPPPDDGQWGAVSSRMRCFEGDVRWCEDLGAQFGPCRISGGALCEAGRLSSARCAPGAQSLRTFSDTVLHCSEALAETL